MTESVVNNNGTAIMMRGFRDILGLSVENDREFVTAQAGATLIEIHMWLKERGKMVSTLGILNDVGYI